jgi:hypothetical protein
VQAIGRAEHPWAERAITDGTLRPRVRARAGFAVAQTSTGPAWRDDAGTRALPESVAVMIVLLVAVTHGERDSIQAGTCIPDRQIEPQT